MPTSGQDSWSVGSTPPADLKALRLAPGGFLIARNSAAYGA